MSVPAPPPKFTPGAVVFAALGLTAFVVSLVVPWINTAIATGSTAVGTTFEEEPTGGFAFGLGSVVYLAGVVLVAGLAAATLATRGAARLGLGIAGLSALTVPVTSLYLVYRRIHDASEAVLAKAAEVSREDPPTVFVAPQAGPILAGLALFLLAVALTRFTWPSHSTAGYAGASAAAVLLVLVLPWATRKVILADRVEVVDYWFPYFGVLGLLGAVAAAVALTSAAVTIALGWRAWWPPLPGLVSAVAAVVAVAPITSDSDVTPDPRFADALSQDVVINSGVPAVCALAGAVMFACTLVLAIVQYGRTSRRRTG